MPELRPITNSPLIARVAFCEMEPRYRTKPGRPECISTVRFCQPVGSVMPLNGSRPIASVDRLVWLDQNSYSAAVASRGDRRREP